MFTKILCLIAMFTAANGQQAESQELNLKRQKYQNDKILYDDQMSQINRQQAKSLKLQNHQHNKILNDDRDMETQYSTWQCVKREMDKKMVEMQQRVSLNRQPQNFSGQQMKTQKTLVSQEQSLPNQQKTIVSQERYEQNFSGQQMKKQKSFPNQQKQSSQSLNKTFDMRVEFQNAESKCKRERKLEEAKNGETQDLY